jgi:hypothetical protein
MIDNDSLDSTALVALAEQTRANPPGRTHLSYRVGTYTSVLHRLISYLTGQHDTEDTTSAPQLDVQASDNWLLGLLQAWSVVIDVLTFYQECIANEGYLRTATERRSVTELVRTIGYELCPGIAASTYLAFTVRNGITGTSQRSLIPKGAAIQSVPTQGRQVLSLPTGDGRTTPAQLSQIFETSTAFEARPEWNALKIAPSIQTGQRRLSAATTILRLDGVKLKLRSGDAILLVGEHTSPGQQSGAWIFGFINTIVPDTKRGYTSITWKDEIRSDQGPAPIKNPQVFVLRQQAKLYTYVRGGVYYSALDAPDWSTSSIGLPHSTVYALVSHKTGHFFAATDEGVFRSQNNGESWERTSIGLMKMSIRALLVADSGILYAGTATGMLFRSVDDGNTWQAILVRRTTVLDIAALLPRIGAQKANGALPKTVIRALSSYQVGNRSYLAAALDSGVWVSADGGSTWKQSPSDVPGPDSGKRGGAWVFASPVAGQAPLVGMDTGVFPIDSNLWKRWHPWFIVGIGIVVVTLLLLLLGIVCSQKTVQATLSDYPPIGQLVFGYANLFNHGLFPILLIVGGIASVALLVGWWLIKHTQVSRLPIEPFHTLVRQHNERLLAASDDGLYLSENDRKQWTVTAQGALKGMQSLVAGPPDLLFAATKEGAVLRAPDSHTAWQDFSHNLHLNDVQALLIGADGIFAAGAPDRADTESQWSRFQIRQRQLDLDKLYLQVATASWIVLRQDQNVAVYQATSVRSTVCRDYKKGRNFTSIQVDDANKLNMFARDSTAVFIQSEQLALYDDEPVQGDTISFDSFVPGLTTDHQMIVSGKRLRLRLIRLSGTTPPVLVAVSGLQQLPLTLGDTLIVMASPVATGSAYQWLLKDRSGFVGYFTANLEEISYEQAEDQDEVVSELVIIRNIKQADSTSVQLESSLRNIYDRSSVTVYGNVVSATHGQTIENEVLGSVDIRQGNNSFMLKQKPLTYTSSIAAEEGTPDTLTVQVNQVAWQQAVSLHDQSASERVYVVRHDSQDNTIIIFGDGFQGAHVPGGREHITATYRVGSGTAGNVPAGSLTLLRTRPPGIQQVTNPLPASGGRDVEAPDMAGINAPRHIQTLQRIVSLSDYERFTQIFAGIDKVQARSLWNGRARLLHITVAGENGAPVQSDSRLYAELQAAINAAVTSPAPVVHIDTFEPLLIQIRATLVLAAASASRASSIVTEATQTLATSFGFYARELGQPLALAQVIAVAQAIDGVLAVKMEALFIKGQDSALNPLLTALLARLDASILRPAQLLLIDAEDEGGIILNVEVTNI